jgi:hypothetical protein
LSYVGFFSSCNPKVKLKEFTSYELRCISHEEPEPSGEGLRFQPFYEDVLAVLLDPGALLVLLVFLPYGLLNARRGPQAGR